jgi:hypothetical protein
MRSDQPSSPAAARNAARRASFEAPSADGTLLGYLLGLLLLMATVAGAISWLARPTVLANAGVAGFERETIERERRVPMTVASASWHEAEKLAADFAQRENQRHGLRLVGGEGQREPPASAALASAKASPPPKAKRVAKAQPRDAAPQWRDNWRDPWADGWRDTRRDGSRNASRDTRRDASHNSWAFAPQRGGSGHSRGWGSWFR